MRAMYNWIDMIEKIKARGEELKTLQGHDRLQYLVDIAREVKPLADNEKIEDNKIRVVLQPMGSR